MAPHHHGPHHHDHTADSRRLAVALGLIVAFMAAEVASGVVAHSLALLSDAAHMLTDAAALSLSLIAARLARRPAGGSMTYGLGRVEVLAAQANGVTLLVLAAFIVYEAITRLVSPPHVHGGLMLAIALVGVAVNVAAVLALSGSPTRSLNLEGSFRHILTDLYAFIGTAAAAGVILASGFERADPIASLIVAALMLKGAYWLLRASARVFLEAAPEGFDVDAIGHALAERPGIVEIHDLHVWEVSSGFPALSAHVLVRRDVDCHATRLHLAELLREHFEIEHTTLQVEHGSGELLEIEPAGPDPPQRASM
ncbi:MAG TPA: cation diffusion facilitator family transporter [Solirubrobacteraceae bacterium]|jgi:cobalt-zinc-cadmium efflux system protein|nr:cation diffusion facilitator family transporter [Solirubrobacteraceae bacterium]